MICKRPDSRTLRNALENAGEIAPEFYAAHHIVAGGAKGAVQARMTLAKYGIDMNDAANGVFLPMTKGVKEAYHNTLHTNVYYDAVNELLSKATDSKQARDILETIAEQLCNNTFPH